jgi:hypothetical protein
LALASAGRHHLRMQRQFSTSSAGLALELASGLLAGARQVPSPNCDDAPGGYRRRPHRRARHQPAAG